MTGVLIPWAWVTTMSSRCKACNVLLDAGEASRSDPSTNLYIELCTPCYIASGYARESLEDILSDDYGDEYEY